MTCEGAGMDRIEEVLRLASPAPRPQSLAYDGTVLWMGSIATERIYALDPTHWTVGDEVAAPGKPWGMTVVGDELRVLCGEAPDDNRFIRRFVPGHGFKETARVPCPDDTGSHLSYDGERLYVSQWYNKKIIALDDDGVAGTTLAAPHGICGQVIVDGRFYLASTDDEANAEAYVLTRLDARADRVVATDIARIGFAARGLAFDGARFWTNHREANEIVAFRAPL